MRQNQIQNKVGGFVIYTTYYNSPLGKILLAADDEGLIGVWFEGQKYFANALSGDSIQMETAIIRQTEKWLDIYFSGKKPDFTPPLHMIGSNFRKLVWKILLDIPYGSTMTYGDIARKVAAETGREKMSAQAVGGAVGHNSISIIIPCHRVVGSDGSLTGYAGGLDKKLALLKLEQVDDADRKGSPLNFTKHV